jgi:hypothetical protein
MEGWRWATAYTSYISQQCHVNGSVPANNGPRRPKGNHRIPNSDHSSSSFRTQESVLKAMTSGVYRKWGLNQDQISVWSRMWTAMLHNWIAALPVPASSDFRVWVGRSIPMAEWKEFIDGASVKIKINKTNATHFIEPRENRVLPRCHSDSAMQTLTFSVSLRDIPSKKGIHEISVNFLKKNTKLFALMPTSSLN